MNKIKDAGGGYLQHKNKQILSGTFYGLNFAELYGEIVCCLMTFYGVDLNSTHKNIRSQTFKISRRFYGPLNDNLCFDLLKIIQYTHGF